MALDVAMATLTSTFFSNFRSWKGRAESRYPHFSGPNSSAFTSMGRLVSRQRSSNPTLEPQIPNPKLEPLLRDGL